MTKRILVIEDNPINMELITYLLRAFNYSVFNAEDGDMGIQLAYQEKFDLIICDVHMPKKDGYEVVKQLKGNPALCMTPIIAVTALAMVGDREKLLSSNFDGYISKPIIPERFVNQIESFMSMAGIEN